MTAVVDNAAHGTVVPQRRRLVHLHPNLRLHGTDTFTYRLFDGSAYSAPATVTITVNSTVPVNHVATAKDISVSMSEDGGLSGVVSTSMTDVEGDPLTASVVGQPAHGTVEFVSAVNYLYRPAANYTGTDTFTYRLFDGTDYSNTATVTITVNPINDARRDRRHRRHRRRHRGHHRRVGQRRRRRR